MRSSALPLVAALAMLTSAMAQAQNVQSSKLNSYIVLENVQIKSSKLNSYIVLQNDDSIRTSKLNSYVVLQPTVLDFSVTEALDWFDGVQAFAAGGGGGGAAGFYGIGELGENGRLDGFGGYGGSADYASTPRQTTPGAAGNAGTEFNSIIGSGSGGGGGDWNDTGLGVNGGVGGTYGGGGGGGGGGIDGGGTGALGGEGVIWIQYTPSGGSPVTIVLDKDSGPTWTVPSDWTTNNRIVLVGAGGCGGNGSNAFGGNGGYGGDAVGGVNITLFTPSSVLALEVNTAVEACNGTGNLHTALGDIAAGDGKSALDNVGFYGGGGSIVPADPGAAVSFLYQGGFGGWGGNLLSFSSTPGGGLHPWQPLTHW